VDGFIAAFGLAGLAGLGISALEEGWSNQADVCWRWFFVAMAFILTFARWSDIFSWPRRFGWSSLAGHFPELLIVSFNRSCGD
jgi:hypothetical protein